MGKHRISRASMGFKSSDTSLTLLIAGSSHRSQPSGSRMTGIRSCTVEVTAFGVVVRIEQVAMISNGDFTHFQTPNPYYLLALLNVRWFCSIQTAASQRSIRFSQ